MAAAKKKPTKRKAPAKKRLTALAAVERDLAAIAKRDKDLAASGLAATALQLAEEIDDPANSATSKSMCAGRLLDALATLRDLAPPEKEKDRLDELSRRRARKAKRGAKPASRVDSAKR